VAALMATNMPGFTVVMKQSAAGE